MVTKSRRQWAWLLALAGVGMWSWPAACVAGGLHVGLVVVRVLVERYRRETLVELVERAPQGTVVVIAPTSELPALWLRVGHEAPRPAAGSLRDAANS
jgi:hypothetical protein